MDASLAHDESAQNGDAPDQSSDLWPKWPSFDSKTEHLLLEALRSRRWTVSGAYTGSPSFEQQFAQSFAQYIGVPHCIPTCHGSSALAIALEALDIGYGDEVIVPGLTWVACASAVSALGAVPVLVDVDPYTLCLSPQAAEAAITERTKAIMAVHLFGSCADVEALTAISKRNAVPLIEDCSQAHGGMWDGQKLGSFGTISAFSLQQTKLLTSGEGGVALTRDPALADKLQQLRADGRRYVAQPRIGHLDLEEVGAVQGRNYCLSEFHAALALDGLERLDDQNQRRRAFVEQLRVDLETLDGVGIQGQPDKLSHPVYYHLCLRFDPTKFKNFDIDVMARSLAEKLSLPAIDPVDTPLNRNLLFNPLHSSRTPPDLKPKMTPGAYPLPHAEQARQTCLTIPHNALLADLKHTTTIINAIKASATEMARAS